MSDDLVKHLRKGEVSIKMSDGSVQLVNHVAADRIEALEKALQTLTAKLYADLDGGRKIRRYDVDRAAAALGEKKDG